MTHRKREPIILKKWGPGTTQHLVEQYALHPCLWDPAHGDYKDVRRRYAALNSIADAMLMHGIDEMDADAVKCKIRVIRNTYTNELRKREGRKMSEIPYKTNLCWFDTADSFLRNVVKVPSSRITEEDAEDESSRNSSHDDVMVELLHPLEDQSSQGSSMPQLELVQEQSDMYPDSYYHPDVRSKRRALHQGYAHPHAVEAEDEFDMFGKNVALQMKLLPMLEALELQAEIQKLICEKRIAVLRNQSKWDHSENATATSSADPSGQCHEDSSFAIVEDNELDVKRHVRN